MCATAFIVGNGLTLSYTLPKAATDLTKTFSRVRSVKLIILKSGFALASFLSHSIHDPHGAIGLSPP